MTRIPDIGKITPEIFDKLILPYLGAKNDKVLVGPKSGVDAGIIEVGDKVVSLTCDPVFIVPEYGWERAAWFAVHIIASDSVTSGLKPVYLSIDLNLPMEMTIEELETVWTTMHRECDKLGITIVCGHTARYENCHYPMVGGATMMGIGDKNEYITPQMARAGDKIIITKGPAIEATGIFVAIFPRLIDSEFGEEFRKKAEQVFYKMSVVEDARLAISVGIRDNGITAMHDATECGIWGGLYELAQSTGMGIIVEKEKIVIEDCVQEVCDYFKIDPYSSISEGTLILSCRPHKADMVVNKLSENGIKCSVAGELTGPGKGVIIIDANIGMRLEHPIVDPFWSTFYRALEEYKSYMK